MLKIVSIHLNSLGSLGTRGFFDTSVTNYYTPAAIQLGKGFEL